MIQAAIKRAFFLDAAGAGPARFRERLQAWGPTFVKFGQFLALRPDLIPDEYSLELMRLFDDVPPFPWSEAQKVLQDSLGQNALASFAYIERCPIGAGSLAQIHAARLRSGQQVAIKIQRPNLREQVLRDLNRARRIIRALRLSGISFAFDTEDLLSEMTAWMMAEIDFGRELRNLKRMYEEAENRTEKFPRPYEELSGSRVVTSELLRGTRVSMLFGQTRSDAKGARAHWESTGFDTEEFANNLLRATLDQIFRRRFFHTDLHPGNLLLMPGNAVGFVDFGLCEETDERVRQRQIQYFIAVYDSDLEGMYLALTDLLIPGEKTNQEAFRQDFFHVMEQWNKRSNGDDKERSPVGQAIAAVMRTVRRHGYRISPQLLGMYRALLGADTVAYQLGSSVMLRDVARDFFRDLQRDEVRRSIDVENIERYLLDVHRLLVKSPRQVNQLLSDLAEGRFYLNVNAEERPRSTRFRNRRAKMITSALIAVSVSLLCANPQPYPGFDRIIRVSLLSALVLVYVWILIQWRRLD